MAVPRRRSSARCPAASSACRVDADGDPALPARAADARAAHPPREGDLQHLHRAGAARRDGRACTPSTTAPTGCARSPQRVHRLTRDPRRAACAAAASRSCTTRSSTRSRVRVPGPRRRGRRGRARSAASTCGASTPTRVGIACDETTTRPHVEARLGRVRRRRRRRRRSTPTTPDALPAGAARARATFLTHPVFHAHRSETQMLRYLRRLADRTSRSTAR